MINPSLSPPKNDVNQNAESDFRAQRDRLTLK